MITLGTDTTTGKQITLDQTSRSRGVYIIGSTGSGKTTLLRSIAYQDMANDHGIIVLDPHGDLIEDLLKTVPTEREKDVLLLDAGDFEHPIPINLLHCDRDNPYEVSRTISNLVDIFRKIHKDSWGPRLEQVITYAFTILMKVKGSTIIDVLYFLEDKKFKTEIKKLLIEQGEEGSLLVGFIDRLIKMTSAREFQEYTASTVNKLTPFLLDESIRPIVGQSEKSIDFRSLMDERKIVLINLSKGKIGQNTSQLLGSVIINLILVSALSRQDLSLKGRESNPIHLIVDEYQNFASDSFATLQSEARKYGVDLVVAHQFRDQLSKELQGSSLNVANFISMRVIGPDSPEMASQFNNTPPPAEEVFKPVMSDHHSIAGEYKASQRYTKQSGQQRTYSDMQMQIANELSTLPNFTGKARLIGAEHQAKEHTFKTVDPDSQQAKKVYGHILAGRPNRLRNLSRALFKDRASALEELKRHFGEKAFEAMKTGLKSPIKPGEWGSGEPLEDVY